MKTVTKCAMGNNAIWQKMRKVTMRDVAANLTLPIAHVSHIAHGSLHISLFGDLS